VVKKYAELYLDARRALLPTEGQFASNVARELICAASGKTAEQLISDRDLYASEEICELAQSFVRRRVAGEPMPYILGEWDFYGMTLTVTPDVLIPRDDTMAVTELAIKKALFLEQNPRILDLCTGSGCIGLAIARRVKDARVTLGDVSPAALRVARQNVGSQRLSGRVKCLTIDVRQPAAPFLGTFDLIVSNPPYVPEGILPGWMHPSGTMSRIWRSGAATTGWIFTAPSCATSPPRSTPAAGFASNSVWARTPPCATCCAAQAMRSRS